MAISNLVLTVVGIGTIAFLMKSDIRRSSATLRRNLRNIRGWMEEQSAAAENAVKEEVKQVGKGTSEPLPPKKE